MSRRPGVVRAQYKMYAGVPLGYTGARQPFVFQQIGTYPIISRGIDLPLSSHAICPKVSRGLISFIHIGKKIGERRINRIHIPVLLGPKNLTSLWQIFTSNHFCKIGWPGKLIYRPSRALTRVTIQKINFLSKGHST